MSSLIAEGDARDRLADIPNQSIHCVITSPPYFGLRDYGVDGQIGLEATPDAYVAELVAVFDEVRRVLRDDGTVWLNLGDSYAGAGYANHSINGEEWYQAASLDKRRGRQQAMKRSCAAQGIKPKDLVGIPWRVAFALQAAGWYLRSDIIWHKPNPMPESVTDRPTRSHEYIFLLTKRARYYYDADAIRENDSGKTSGNGYARAHRLSYTNDDGSVRGSEDPWLPGGGRNKRSVWTVATQPYAEAHFATFPPALVEPCVLAGTPPTACGECGAPWRRDTQRERTFDGRPVKKASGWVGPDAPRRMNDGKGHWRWATHVHTLGWQPSCAHTDDTGRAHILDPFAGSGTVGVVACWHGRDFTGIELNPEYAAMARRRIQLEGRPGGKPATHEPASIIAGQLGLLDSA